jgi:phosphoribosylformylglycinamidine synthase
MHKPHVLVLRAPGSNCDNDAAFAFEQAGAIVEKIHINRLREDAKLLKRYQIFVVPGGFTYGDDVAAGKILAGQLQHYLGDGLRHFRDAGKLILGICNGFQALLKAGLIMPPDEDGPVATLAHNDSGRFEDRWVWLQADATRCPWFLNGYQRFYVPIAHGEGKFVCREPWICKGLEQTGQICLKFVDAEGKTGGYPVNPNGSQAEAAGVCDATGRVLGLMPHPERHVLPTEHPQWTRHGLAPEGDGLRLFKNAVGFFQ